MKIKKREDKWVDTLFLLRIGNKIPMRGVSERNFGAENGRMTIQRLSHLGIHPINKTNPDTIAYANKILLKGP